ALPLLQPCQPQLQVLDPPLPAARQTPGRSRREPSDDPAEDERYEPGDQDRNEQWKGDRPFERPEADLHDFAIRDREQHDRYAHDESNDPRDKTHQALLTRPPGMGRLPPDPQPAP